jgi:hypothetical protein
MFQRALLCAFACAQIAGATTILSEGFGNVGTLGGAGWVFVNNSTAPVPPEWFQGNPGVLPAFSGAPNSYIASNFLVTSSGDISNWLPLPATTISNGYSFSFYTISAGDPPDSLELRLSTNGASTNVGTTTTSLGDFTTLLLSINPGLSPGGYPTTWTQYTATISGLGGPTLARLALHYVVTDTSHERELHRDRFG